MRKYIITFVILLVLGVAGFFGYRAVQARRQANVLSSLQTVTAAQGSLTSTIGATGLVHADQTAMLTWETTGNVNEVLVETGQHVNAGDTLASLLPSSLPQNIILAQSDLIAARDALTQLTNPELSTIATSEKALAAAYAGYQQAQANLNNAIIINQGANDATLYNDWFDKKAVLDAARNDLPLANASIDVQVYFQAVRTTRQLQESLDVAHESASAQPGDVPLAQKAADLQRALDENLARQDALQAGLPADTVSMVDALSNSLSAYEAATQFFVGSVITDTATASVDLATIQADLAQRQSDLIAAQTQLEDLVNQRQNMNGRRCDDATIAEYQEAYDLALNVYDFSGRIINSPEYQLMQTAAANLNWCTAVWSDDDIAAQDAKISTARAQIQLFQAQISADQNQVADASGSVYGLAISLNTVWSAYRDASQQLNAAVTTLYELERSPDPDNIAAAQARVQAAQKAVDARALTAPFSGTVTQVEAKPGDLVAPGTIAFRLDKLDRLLVDVQVSEVDINSIRVDRPVTLSFDAILDKEYRGVVSQVSAVGDVIQGVVEFNVVVELTDADEQVKPGMTAAVNIIVEEINDTLLVPNRAVRVVDGQRVVYILKDGTLEEVMVTLGASSETESQVLESDLKAGDQIVLNPPQDFFSGSGGGPFGMGR
jgi:multidrug efflux pump subunit AcrA (membrane-fusion protein)